MRYPGISGDIIAWLLQESTVEVESERSLRVSTAPQPRIMTPEMLKLGFEEVLPTESTEPRLVCCTEAGEKQGKTHFAFTCPGPVVGVLSTDAGTREVLRKFLPGGTLATKHRFIFKSIAKAKDLVADKANSGLVDKAWQEAKDCMEAFVNNRQVRTIIADTGTEMWELCRLCRFGKLSQVMPHQYGPVNDEFRKSILKLPVERDGLNAVFIHKVKREYKSGKDGKDSWTGKWERSGFADAPYVADVVLKHYRRDTDPEENDGSRCTFGFRVLDSRFEPESVVGVEFEGQSATFDMLAMQCFPDTDPGYWE